MAAHALRRPWPPGRPTSPAASLVIVAAVTIVVPGALLAAVTPMVTKLMLTSLAETGTVVGRLSGIATAGAIVGTVVTGFVLISRVPVTGIMVGLGLRAAARSDRRRDRRTPPAAGAPAGPAPARHRRHRRSRPAAATPRRSTTAPRSAAIPAVPAARAGSSCSTGCCTPTSTSTTPTHLQFAYIKALAGVVDASFEPRRAAGRLPPRWRGPDLPALPRRDPARHPQPGLGDRPGCRGGRRRAARPARPGPDLEVRVEDGRTGIRRVADDSRRPGRRRRLRRRQRARGT